MINFTLRVVVPTAKRRELVRSIGALLAPTRVQPGCVDARLYVDTEEANAFALVEVWESRSDLDRYLASEVYKTIVAAMELSTVPPQVRFDTIERSAGMEVFAEARLGRGRRGG